MAQITATNIKQIRADLEAALKTIYAKHGIDVSVGRITYNDSNFRCKIEGNVRGAGATAPVSPKKSPAAMNMVKTLLGSKFTEDAVYTDTQLGKVKVTGYNGRARKYPFIITQVSTGKNYVGSLMQVNRIIERGVAA